MQETAATQVGQFYTDDHNIYSFTMLPSVETQTVQFVHDARRCNDLVQARNLKFGGFCVYIKFKRDVNTGRETLIVSAVESPVRYRCQMQSNFEPQSA